MKKYLIYVFLIFSFVSFEAFSQEQEENTCGLNEDGTIKPFDVTICKDDIAFSVLYENFKVFYDDYVFSIFPLEQWENVQGESDDLASRIRSSIVVSALFKTLISVTITFIMIVIFFNIIVGTLKSLQDGSFMGKDFSFRGQMSYYLIGIFLVIPIGDVFVIHVIILIIALVALIPANLMFTYFLFTVSTLANPDLNTNNELTFKEHDHNYYNASRLVDFYVSSEFCRISTFNYILTDAADNLNEKQNFYDCFLPDEKKSFFSGVDSFNDITPFDNYYVLGRDESEYAFYSNLSRGKNLESQYCEENNYGEHYSNYDCGNMTTKSVNVASYDVLSINYEMFVNSIRETVSKIDYGKINHEELTNDFISFFERYENYANEIVLGNQIINNDNVSEEDAIYSRYAKETANNFVFGGRSIGLKKELIEAWHLAIYNHIHLGTHIVNQTKNGYSTVYKNNVFVNGLKDDLNLLADDFYYYHCLVNFENIVSTYNFVNETNDSDKTAFCYNYKNSSGYGVDEFGDELSDLENINEETLEEIYAVIGTVSERMKQRKDYVMDILIHNLRAIDQSINLSVNEMNFNRSNLDVFQKARQGGFLAYPQILLFIDQDNSEMTPIRRSIFSSVKMSLLADHNMNISEYVYESGLAKNNNSFLIEDEMVNSYQGRLYDQSLINNSPLRDPEAYWDSDGTDDPDLWDKMLESLLAIIPTQPGAPLMSALGMQYSGIYEEDFALVCGDVNDLANCPLPQKNPLVSFNQLGLHYMAVGGKIIAGSTGVYFLASKLGKMNKKPTKVDGGGFVNNMRNKILDNNKNKTSMLKVVSFLTSLMIGLGVTVLFLGAIMAFAIPLIPFIYLVVNFMQWLLHVFNLLFVANIFIGYLFNISESRNEVVKFFKNNILHIVLMPTFIIISMIFLWSFYYVLIFFVNITFFTAMSQIMSDHPILGSLHELMIIAMLIYIIYTLTKFVFNQTSIIYQKLFEMLETQEVDTSTDSVFDNIFTFMALDSSRQNLTQRLQNNIKEREFKEVGLREKLNNREDILEKLLDKDNENPYNEIGKVRDKYGVEREVDKDNLLFGDTQYETEEDLARAINGEFVFDKQNKKKIKNRSDLYRAFMGQEESIEKLEGLVDNLNIKDLEYNEEKFKNKTHLMERIKLDRQDLFNVNVDKEAQSILNAHLNSNANNLNQAFGNFKGDRATMRSELMEQIKLMEAADMDTDDLKKLLRKNIIGKNT